jgi:exopolyphosphatase/pppGpp-phosphohydrolase
MGTEFVIDCGSRSIKLHEAGAQAARLRATRSWDPINDARHADRVGALLLELTEDLPAVAAVHVVGTAAARRSAAVASAIADACRALGWSYETLSQQKEAALIRQAFAGREDCDIVNVGGGSIQIVEPTGEATLLPFGISDLNREFALSGAPRQRSVAEATAYVDACLPNLNRPFVYSGGELSYLRAFGAQMDPEGRCSASEFRRVADRVDRMGTRRLARLSPFDAGWTSGAVASNAIVRACLDRARVGFYFASDVNIADGVLSLVARGGRHATDPGF